MKFYTTLAATAAVLLVMTGAAAKAAPAARAEVESFAQLASPLPYPYDPVADADPRAVEAKIAAARAKARRDHKLLLIDFGGNWCADCRILSGTMELPNLKTFIPHSPDDFGTLTAKFGK